MWSLKNVSRMFTVAPTWKQPKCSSMDQQMGRSDTRVTEKGRKCVCHRMDGL